MVSTLVPSLDSRNIDISGLPMAYDIMLTNVTAGVSKGVSY